MSDELCSLSIGYEKAFISSTLVAKAFLSGFTRNAHGLCVLNFCSSAVGISLAIGRRSRAKMPDLKKINILGRSSYETIF